MAVASEKSFPFDSDQVNGVYDREYFADDFARFFRAFIYSGTFMKEGTNLQVIANGDMSVTLKPGSMIIDGYRYDNVADIIINLSPADGVLKRIDRISATWSKEDRDIHYVVRESDYSYEPMAPECRRTAEYKDYVVADIMVDAGAITIKQSDILDQRLNPEVCGLAMPFGEVDTSKLYDQIQSALEEFKSVNQTNFAKWFELIKDKLSEDAAGKLLAMIGLLEELTTQEKDSLVGAINEVNGKEVEVVDPMIAEEEGTAADAKLTGDVLKELNAKMPSWGEYEAIKFPYTPEQDGVFRVFLSFTTTGGTTTLKEDGKNILSVLLRDVSITTFIPSRKGKNYTLSLGGISSSGFEFLPFSFKS